MSILQQSKSGVKLINRQYTDKDLSIVFQGAISLDFSRKCVESARQLFPNSEIIISTWNNSEVGFISGHDKVIYNEDPGTVPGPAVGCVNLNRQIVSTRAGIASSSRPLCIKLRLDCKFEHNRALDWYNTYKHIPAEAYTSRIFACNCYTLSHDPAYICDYFYMGLKDDLVRMFDIDLVKFAAPEIGPEHYLSTSQYRVDPAKNFVILDSFDQCGMINCKYPYQRNKWTGEILSHQEWKQKYESLHGSL